MNSSAHTDDSGVTVFDPIMLMVFSLAQPARATAIASRPAIGSINHLFIPLIYMFSPPNVTFHRKPRWIPASLLAGGKRLAIRRGEYVCQGTVAGDIKMTWV
jgi:hypothetical protein